MQSWYSFKKILSADHDGVFTFVLKRRLSIQNKQFITLPSIDGKRYVKGGWFLVKIITSIHFWPGNAQKTTLNLLTFFGPRHPALLWDRPKWFSKGLFLILHPLLVRTGQKNDFEIFLAERVEGVWATL